jgi:hypothetical protein
MCLNSINGNLKSQTILTIFININIVTLLEFSYLMLITIIIKVIILSVYIFILF